MNITIGENIKKLRNQKGITLKGLLRALELLRRLSAVGNPNPDIPQ